MRNILITKRYIKDGFSLIEVLIVIAIIGILSSVIISNVRDVRDAAYFVKSKVELKSVYESVELYKADHNDSYPADTDRDVPPGLQQYLGPGIWPDAAWPGSVFDWENWTEPNTGKKIFQISIRFCPAGGQLVQCHFPDEDWAEDFGVNSAVFYCLGGPCRPHINEQPNYPGYCVNCKEPEYPYGIY